MATATSGINIFSLYYHDKDVTLLPIAVVNSFPQRQGEALSIHEVTYAVTSWMDRPNSEESVVKVDTTTFSDIICENGGDTDVSLDGGLTLTNVYARILEHKRQILTDCDVDELLALLKYSFGESSAAQKFGEIELSSEGKHDITVVSVHGRMSESSPPTDEPSAIQKFGEMDLSSEGEHDITVVSVHEGMGKLLALLKYSFGESSAAQKIGEMVLSSEGEHDITVVSVHGRMSESFPPTDQGQEEPKVVSR
ncbi:hypothetical protein FF38_10810 [Lucilia cuprina]|uniref:Uncharacterized protein n=1 Tax=Lucilia cuprina TaxID=7375 RepID=A0A0L0CKN6_LUCCU|nr:hypothetical protein FF38_10810 [Lucilia cuprina]